MIKVLKMLPAFHLSTDSGTSMRTVLILLCWTTISSVAQVTEFQWQTATPESQGMSSAKLDTLKDELAGKNTAAFLVIRNDKTVYEWYANGRTANHKHHTASLAKAIVGGMSLAVAMNDGLISIDDKASKYVPQWQDHAQKSQITIRQLGSHTSGIDDSHNRQEQKRGVDQGSYTGWAGEFWRWRQRKSGEPQDAFTLSRDVAPMRFAPGTDFQYSNPGIAMLTYCVTASLKGKPHGDIRTLLRERIMRPIGVPDNAWSCGYGKMERVDSLPLVASWGGGAYTPRAVARIGRLVLREGDWEGKRLVSPDVIRRATQDAGLPGNCGMGWWTNAGGRFANLPHDAMWGAGAGHQTLLVVPSLSLICVRNGGPLVPRDMAGYPLARGPHLFDPLMEAVIDATPSFD